MSAIPCTAWQDGFLQILPAIQHHARIRFRHLRPVDRQEAVAEAIASACLAYQRLAAQGRLHVARPGTLATYAVKQARAGRHVGGSQDAARDVMSPICQRRHGVRVESYDEQAANANPDWKEQAIARRQDSIPDTAAFRIDFEDWLWTLGRRDRRVIAALVRGDRTMEVAQRFGLSEGRVSQLRRRYEQGWGMFQGETAPQATAA